MSAVKLIRFVPFTGTDAALAALNPIPNQSEIIVVKPTSGIGQFQIKIGDGVTAYSGLPFFATGGGAGDYLGLATTTTNPPALSEDAYYLTVEHGTFTYIGGLVVPSTALLTILSYDFPSTTWTYTEVLDSGTLTTPTIDEVLNVGNTATNKNMVMNNTGGAPVVSLITNGSAPAVIVDNLTDQVVINGNVITGYKDSPSVVQQWTIGTYGGVPIMALNDSTSAYSFLLKCAALSASITLTTPQVTCNLVGDVAAQTLTNKRGVCRVLTLSANSATPAINTDNYDTVIITAQSANITSMSSGLTGTPNTDDMLHIAFNTTGTITISWGAAFESSTTTTLPTGITGAVRIDCYFIFSGITSKWRIQSIV